MKKTILLTCLTVLLSACTAGSEGIPPSGNTTLDGAHFSLAEALNDKPTIVNFWASWCPFCTTELPLFQKVQAENPGLQVIAVNMQEDPSTAKNFWKKNNLEFTSLLDPESALKSFYGVVTQPTTLFLNAKGEVIERRDGPLSEEELNEYIKKIMPKTTLEPPKNPLMEHHPESETGDDVKISPTPGFLRRWSDKYGSTVKHSVELDEILSGGVPKDGIPAIDKPKFVSTKDAKAFLKKDDLGAVYMNGDTVRFYPFRILNWHEIINDTVDGMPIMITYCPLCDSSAVYSRKISVGAPTFGVSGFLMQNNLVMYDRKTETLWHQIMGEAVAGELTGEKFELLPSNIMDFATAKEHYPDIEVLSTE
jgi:thiol-disulfide isomerase/thioredoxin